MSRAKQRGTSSWFEVFRVRLWFPELFSWLFYVAASRLNSPRLSVRLYAWRGDAVKQGAFDIGTLQ